LFSSLHLPKYLLISPFVLDFIFFLYLMHQVKLVNFRIVSKGSRFKIWNLLPWLRHYLVHWQIKYFRIWHFYNWFTMMNSFLTNPKIFHLLLGFNNKHFFIFFGKPCHRNYHNNHQFSWLFFLYHFNELHQVLLEFKIKEPI
jgi:hypothetical protein